MALLCSKHSLRQATGDSLTAKAGGNFVFQQIPLLVHNIPSNRIHSPQQSNGARTAENWYLQDTVSVRAFQKQRYGKCCQRWKRSLAEGEINESVVLSGRPRHETLHSTPNLLQGRAYESLGSHMVTFLTKALVERSSKKYFRSVHTIWQQSQDPIPCWNIHCPVSALYNARKQQMLWKVSEKPGQRHVWQWASSALHESREAFIFNRILSLVTKWIVSWKTKNFALQGHPTSASDVDHMDSCPSLRRSFDPISARLLNQNTQVVKGEGEIKRLGWHWVSSAKWCSWEDFLRLTKLVAMALHSIPLDRALSQF